jgi:tight adherence protein C
MGLLIIAAVGLFGVALAAVAWGSVLSRNRAELRLGEIDAYGYEAAAPASAVVPNGGGAPRALAERVGALLGARFGTGPDGRIKQELLAAAWYDLTPQAFAGYQVFGAAAGAALGLMTDPVAVIPGPLFDSALLAGIGWLLPSTYLRRTGRLRLDEVDRTLPDAIDLIVVAVESGQGFAQAFDMAARRASGPLGAELRLTLQEQRFGLPMERALENLRARADTPNVQTLVRAVVQGERLGVSIGQIMRAVSHDMRLRRRQAAEERAQKTTIKILFPLIFLIMPAMFVTLLAPALLGLLEAVGA